MSGGRGRCVSGQELRPGQEEREPRELIIALTIGNPLILWPNRVVRVSLGILHYVVRAGADHHPSASRAASGFWPGSVGYRTLNSVKSCELVDLDKHLRPKAGASPAKRRAK